jgi:hypothetical protein
MTLSDDLRSLVRFGDSPVRWPVATQAGLAMAVPIAGFTLAGHSDWGLFASGGAFIAIYLANRPRRLRARALPLLGLGLLAAAAIGILTSSSLPLSLLGLAAIAIAGTALLLGFAVGPPGVLFFVLVGGLSGHLAGPEGGRVNGWLILGLIAVGSAIAYVIVLAPLLVPRIRARDAAVPSVPLRFTLGAAERVLLLRITLGVAIGALLAAPLGLSRAYWVLLTIVAVLQVGSPLRLTALRGVHRVLGTLVGAGVFALVALLRPEGLWLALLVGGLQFVAELLVIRHYGLALVVITPLALTIASVGDTAHAAELAGVRILDTVLGAAIAFLVLLGALAVRRIRADRG